MRSCQWQHLKAQNEEIDFQFFRENKYILSFDSCVTNTKCKILIQNTISDPFFIETGLTQGDSLSTILFNFAVEKVIRAMSINWRETILNTSKQIAASADDADLLVGELVGLTVSEEKTKYLTLDRKEGSRIDQNMNTTSKLVQSL